MRQSTVIGSEHTILDTLEELCSYRDRLRVRMSAMILARESGRAYHKLLDEWHGVLTLSGQLEVMRKFGNDLRGFAYAVDGEMVAALDGVLS